MSEVDGRGVGAAFKRFPPNRPNSSLGQDYSWPHHPECSYIASRGIEWCDCRDAAPPSPTALEAADELYEAAEEMVQHAQRGDWEGWTKLQETRDRTAAALDRYRRTREKEGR